MAIIVPKLQFLDLSHYSWPVQWDRLALNPDLIAVGWKASQGQSNRDGYFKQARLEIEKRGYLFCAYHFGDHSNVTGQVNNFLDAVGDLGNIRLALDWEDNRGNQMIHADAEAFVLECDKRTGRKITIYTGNTAKDQMGSVKSEVLGSHPLWIPRYSSYLPQPQASWSDWEIWQYAADGNGPEPRTANGCTGYPDCNVFAKPVDWIKANWSGKLVADPAPGPVPMHYDIIDVDRPNGAPIVVRVNGKTVYQG